VSEVPFGFRRVVQPLHFAGIFVGKHRSNPNCGAEAAPTVTTFHFTDQGDDLAGRITTDAASNFYVSAALDSVSHTSCFAVLKYNSKGKLQGAFRYKNAPGEFQGAAQAVKVHKQSNIYAAGKTSVSGLVVSFTSVGVQRWADRFGGGAGNPIALAIDASGNIYAAGNGGHGGSDGLGPILEWVIVKYSSNGEVLWEQHHTGAPSLDSRVTDIQLDSAGYPIVFGTTSNSLLTLTNNMTVVKFDPQGNTLWARDFAVPHNSQIPGGLAVDHDGNVYATSLTNPPEGLNMASTVKYDLNGVLKFVLQGKDAGGSSVAIDPAGDILLTRFTTNFGRPPSIEATKIHPSGARVWVTQIAATGKIVCDSAGNVFVAGTPGFRITKLSPSGTVLFSSSVLPNDDVIDAVVDPLDHLLATGDGVNARFEHDIIFTVKLN
jgi:sugar lactone lactonase YvrE